MMFYNVETGIFCKMCICWFVLQINAVTIKLFVEEQGENVWLS